MSDFLENIISQVKIASRQEEFPLRLLEIERGLIARAPELLRQIGFDACSVVVVSDRYTHLAAGEAIEQTLKKAGFDVKSAIFGEEYLKPTVAAVEKVQEAVEGVELCIAVGSGTVNDICKRASYLAKKPYMVFATAPSMNGYASANASLVVDECRASLEARLPVGVVMDLDVLASAPKRLIRSGIGDMLCRSTVQSDWLFSHLLLDTPYDEGAFSMIAEEEGILLENAADIVAGDENGLLALSLALVKSGVAMWMCQGSYPASQSEHMVAHVMEMAFPQESLRSYHGEQIAVTTLAMSVYQELLLSRDEAPEIINVINKQEMEIYFSSDQCFHAQEAWKQKQEVVARINTKKRLLQNWSDYRERLQGVLEPKENLQEAFLAAGLALTPEAIGWSSEHFAWAMKVAYATRNRFTFLDVV